MILEMHGKCSHYSDYRSVITTPKTAIYCGPQCGNFHSINVTHDIHGPTIMSRAVPKKSDVASQACPP